MTGQNKTEQENPADAESLILVGECKYERDAFEFISAKVGMDGWHIMAQPFPLDVHTIHVADPLAPKVDGKTPTKPQYVPLSWGFVLHKFY